MHQMTSRSDKDIQLPLRTNPFSLENQDSACGIRLFMYSLR